MNEKRTILLTGTGTIGRELLLEFVRGNFHKVFVLMRGKGKRDVRARANLLFEKLGLSGEVQSRIVILDGDVTRENFALDEKTIARLTKELDFIIHTAAVTSLTADEILCESVNVDGTKNALALAENCLKNGKLRRFVHLSTAFVAGAENASHLIPENDLPNAPKHFNFYEKSKYEAEKLVRSAMKNGFPASVFRPAMVVGDTETGWTRDFNVIYPLVRILASGYIKIFPADSNGYVHLSPINFVVRAIAESLEKDWTKGETFNLTANAPPTVADLFACESFFPANAARPKLCSPDEFDWNNCAARERELLESVEFCLPYFNSRLAFETANAARLVNLPEIDANYLDLLGRFAAESGYLRQAREAHF
ncbi:MAG: SDR family oxidoreductase [Acidobacteriota bacterium]